MSNTIRRSILNSKSTLRPLLPAHRFTYPTFISQLAARLHTRQNTMTGNVWFIAGASNGFGRAIAFEALKRGDKVVATSRNPAKMAELKDAGALVLALDVTADDATIQATLQKVVDTYGKITHCVNAAGYILEAAIEEAS